MRKIKKDSQSFKTAYKFPPAMALAAKRAKAVQPAFISIANVGIYRTRSAGGEHTED